MRGRRQAGFALLELAVASTILLFVMLIAIQLLGEAGSLLAKAQVEFAEPSEELTTRWLRRDVQGAKEFGFQVLGTKTSPMELGGLPEGNVRYERVGFRLDRVIIDRTGEEVGRRTLLRRVSGWQWKALSAELVEIEIKHQRLTRTAATRSGGPPIELEELTLRRRFALRGAPRGFW